ncbi:MAG: carbamoyltransferase [Lentisphaerae bacterium]|nr:carbamoyltransferase [Lentisphaerota bacterium]
MLVKRKKKRSVLGVQLSHDYAACLVQDGAVVAAVAEERLNRRKHCHWTEQERDNLAVKYCLDAGGIGPDDLDAVVFTMVNFLQPEKMRVALRGFRHAGRMHMIGHHLSHAASAYYASPFDEAAILIMDGGGAFERGQGIELESMYMGRAGRIELLEQTYARPAEGGLCDRISLGWLYQGVTIRIGFGSFDAGKTMGLAPYGRPGRFDDLVLFDDGLPRPNPSYIRCPYPKLGSDPDQFFNVGAGLPRRERDEMLTQEHMDLAADAQDKLEKAVIALANRLYERTRCPNLCMSGGVALNCVTNKMVLDRTPFERIFVQPAATDDGTALGNALYGWRDILGGDGGLYTMRHAYLGRSYDRGRMRRAARRAADRVAVAAEGDVLEEAAARLEQGQILAWYQGGGEFGPRALGHRSILADPRRPDMKAVLNSRVKFREAFRPYAPAVLAEKCGEYFELEAESPFMLLAAKTRSDRVPAITHVDGTARVQTVTREQSAEYYDLIRRFGERTGVPVLLNTSFNVAGQPIVETPDDAVETFASTAIDALVMGDLLLVKR